MKITLGMLERAGACLEQRELFEDLFPDGADLTVDLAVRHATDFDWDWARCLLSARAWAEYDKVRAAAWAEYDKVAAAAWAEYDKVRAPAWAEYDKVRAAARAEYDKAQAAAWASAALAHGLVS